MLLISCDSLSTLIWVSLPPPIRCRSLAHCHSDSRNDLLLQPQAPHCDAVADIAAAFDCHRDCDAPAALVAAAVAGAAADVADVLPTPLDRSDCDDSVRETGVARSDSIPRYGKKYHTVVAIYICKPQL